MRHRGEVNGCAMGWWSRSPVPPNVGKSTLMNQLARREVAIVSPHAGTTRDVIEVQLDLDGYPVTVIDTAGIRETDDPVEQEGVRRARARAAEADLVLWLVDDDSARCSPSRAPRRCGWCATRSISMRGPRPCMACGPDGADFGISASRGDGVGELIAALVGFARDYFGAGEGGLIGRERQRELLQRDGGFAAAQHRRLSARARNLSRRICGRRPTALGRLLGRVDVEDILDVIFREFCIGK